MELLDAEIASLRERLAALRYSRRKIARLAGLGDQAVTDFLLDRREASQRTLRKLHKAFAPPALVTSRSGRSRANATGGG